MKKQVSEMCVTKEFRLLISSKQLMVITIIMQNAAFS
jgi:hypothetical protein